MGWVIGDNITKTCPCNIHVKIENSKAVLTEAILTSTHNLCFGSKIRRIGTPPANPSSTILKGGMRGHTFMDMFS